MENPNPGVDQTMLRSMSIQQMHNLLLTYKLPRLGRKLELIQRIERLILHLPENQVTKVYISVYEHVNVIKMSNCDDLANRRDTEIINKH